MHTAIGTAGGLVCIHSVAFKETTWRLRYRLHINVAIDIDILPFNIFARGSSGIFCPNVTPLISTRYFLRATRG